MADNVVANPGSGGATFATDDISSVHYPIVKLAYGALESATLVSTSAGLPCSQQGTWTVAVSGTVTVSGTVAVSGVVDVTPASPVATDYLPVRLTNGTAFDPTMTVSGTITANAGTGTFTVGDGGGSLTVDGTITANIGTTNGLALDATLTGGTAKAITRGGAKGATSAADMTSTAEGADHQALDVQVYHGGTAINPASIRALTSSDVVTANQGGSWTVTISGTAAVTQSGTWSVRAQDGSGNALASATTTPGGTEQALIVRNIPSGTQTVSGTITANAGSGTFTVAGTATVTQGAAAAASGGWPVRVSDGTNLINVGDNANSAVRVNIVSGSAGSPSKTDDAAFTVATDTVSPIGAMFDNTLPDSVDEGDVGIVRMAANRCLFVNLRDAAGNERGLNVDASGNIGVTDASGSLTVDGTITANAGTGNFATNLAQYAGSTVGASNAVHVQPGTGVTWTAVQATASSLNAEVQGDAAHDAAVSGNPVLLAGYASNAAPTAVSDDGDAVRIWCSRTGIVQIGDGGGSLTVDGTVAVSGTVTVDSELTTADLDTGAGTDTRAVVGLVYGASGGGVLVSTTNPLPVADGGGSLTVDNAGTFAVQVDGAALTSLQLIDDTVATDGSAATAKLIQVGGTDGTNAQIFSTNSSGHLAIQDGGNSITVDNAGTFAVQAAQSGTWNVATVTTVTTVSTVTTVTAVSDAQVQGKAAHDAGVSGNPVLIGGYGSAAEPTAVSGDADAVRIWTDRRGRQIIRQQCGTPAQSSVGGSASNVTLLGANTGRLGATIYNDSTAILYLKLGATASTTSFTVKMAADTYFEVPFGYTGIVDGIWASATGNARITEIT